MKIGRIILAFSIAFFLFSCGRQPKVPKPFGYFRITLPGKEYQTYNTSCPYSFSYPVYAVIENDTDANTEPCWINIRFPALNATIHCSYKQNKDELGGYIKDSRTLVYKHTVKADAINEIPINDTLRNVYGMLYDIKGNAASSVQFYLTDSVARFMRGALYFNCPPNKDSIAPVLQFVQEDIDTLLKTFIWK